MAQQNIEVLFIDIAVQLQLDCRYFEIELLDNGFFCLLWQIIDAVNAVLYFVEQGGGIESLEQVDMDHRVPLSSAGVDAFDSDNIFDRFLNGYGNTDFHLFGRGAGVERGDGDHVDRQVGIEFAADIV